jgi:hypothetical protein
LLGKVKNTHPSGDNKLTVPFMSLELNGNVLARGKVAGCLRYWDVLKGRCRQRRLKGLEQTLGMLSC